MNEHGFIRAIHRQLQENLYRWKINDSFAGGVADAFYSGPEGALFVEYKYLNAKALPKKDTTIIVPKVNALQNIWLTDRYKDFYQFPHFDVVVIMGTPVGSIIFTHLAWEEGISRSDLDKNALSHKEVADVLHSHCITGKENVGFNTACYWPKRQGQCKTPQQHLDKQKGGA